MSVYTTEIASETISSDNPIHQRLLKAYLVASEMGLSGDLLEVGCGEGRGVKYLSDKVNSFTGIDKIKEIIDKLSADYPASQFFSMTIPPISFPDNSFDFIASFQVIEHIKDDHKFLEEIYRILRPGGKALITTPNRKLSLSRNPWHIREYLSHELTELGQKYFDSIEMKGIHGNERVMEYYESNKESVDRMMRWDVLDLQHKLPNWALRIPYDILNRINRNSLETDDNSLVASITADDYFLSEDPGNSLDLFMIASKK